MSGGFICRMADRPDRGARCQASPPALRPIHARFASSPGCSTNSVENCRRGSGFRSQWGLLEGPSRAALHAAVAPFAADHFITPRCSGVLSVAEEFPFVTQWWVRRSARARYVTMSATLRCICRASTVSRFVLTGSAGLIRPDARPLSSAPAPDPGRCHQRSHVTQLLARHRRRGDRSWRGRAARADPRATHHCQAWIWPGSSRHCPLSG